MDMRGGGNYRRYVRSVLANSGRFIISPGRLENKTKKA